MGSAEEHLLQRIRELEEENFDLTQKSKMLERLALTDPLTGLPNRRAMDRLAERELKRRQRFPGPIAMLIVDVDDFKAINSRYLLTGGDEVLMRLARVLVACLQPADSVGRIGGEEFLILAPNADRNRAVFLADRIRSDVQRTEFTYRGEKIGVTVSVGIAVAEAGVVADYEQMKHTAAVALAQGW